MINGKSKESRDVAVHSSQYSDKLESLLSFLEEHCEQGNDRDDKLSGNDGGREAGGVSPSRRARTGLVDITNHGSSRRYSQHGEPERREALVGQNEEAFEDLDDSFDVSRKARGSGAKPCVMREKKYIWDDWSEIGDGEMVLPKDEARMAAGDNLEESVRCEQPIGMPADAHQQLQELKLMSREIQARAAAMKNALEQKRKVVAELHATRVKNESEHVKKMKSVKQEWKKRLESVNTERDRVTDEQENLRETLRKDCESLEKTISNFQADIETTVKSEREICERLKRDGMHGLEEARKSWQNAEREELKKRDHKMSPKLKRDAAKAVEPKLRQLMEKNKEDMERLEREAVMELDCYKLELCKRANAEFKKETNKIKADEKKRMEKLEAEWIAKMESSGNEHEAEMKGVREEHGQRAAIIKRQLNADKRKCTDEHGAALEDARKADELDLRQLRVRHEREMVTMEEEYSEKNAQKQKMCEVEHKQWMGRREVELNEEEELKLKDEHTKMRNKIQSDIDLVKQKLEAEKMEKRQQIEMDTVEKNVEIKEKYDAENQRLENKLKQATKESAMLQKKEAEESRLLDGLQNKRMGLEESFRGKENQAIMLEKRLAALIEECDQQLIDIHQDGERRVEQSRNERELLEKKLDNLIANHPEQQDGWATELKDLKANNGEEVILAETKIRAMIESKAHRLKGASAKLFQLREENTNVEKQLDDARKILVLGNGTQY